MKRKIIAFCGFQGSGKSYSAERLVMTRGFKSLAFADALREVGFSAIGLSFEEGMKNYDELKKTQLINGITFRNILENIGTEIRKYDFDFWVKCVLKRVNECGNNICISDLRFYNEYKHLRDYCKEHDIDFKLIYCDYKSETYKDDNMHESARLAKYLKDLGYQDQQYVSDIDMESYSIIELSNRM